jgi:tRNA/rRNA methyltransferase
MNRGFELRVVLTRTIYERNIGSTSRAMANMGFDKLILVGPQCEITFEAQQAAATGQAPLQNRKVYANWEEFYKNEPDSIRIATTARDGKGRAVRDLAETLNEIKATSPAFQKQSDEPVVVHLIFGPEDWGLAASDIEFVHFCCSIPTFGENSSLNLAQAVLLALFVVRQNWGGERTRLDGQQPDRKKLARPEVFPEKTLREWITAMGFDISNRRINAYTVLKRMLLQNTPTPKEYVILETVLQQSIRKLNEYNQMRKEKNLN